MRDCGHIKIVELQKLGYRLHSILKCEHGLSCDITELLPKDGLVVGEILLKLISELQAFVQLDPCLDLGCNHRH